MNLFDVTSSPISSIFGVTIVTMVLLIHFRIIEYSQVYFSSESIFNDHEYWRLFTCLFIFGRFDISTIISIINVYSSCVSIESKCFPLRPLDFLLFCLFGWVVLWILALKMSIFYLGNLFKLYLLYYNAKRSPNEQIIIIAIPIPIRYTLYTCILIIMEIYFNSFKQSIPLLISFGAAHAYFFLNDVLGLKYDRYIFRLPSGINRAVQKIFE